MARGRSTQQPDRSELPYSDANMEMEADADQSSKLRTFAILDLCELPLPFRHVAMRGAKRKLLENPGKCKSQVHYSIY